jgi:hypothetical protein
VARAGRADDLQGGGTFRREAQLLRTRLLELEKKDTAAGIEPPAASLQESGTPERVPDPAGVSEGGGPASRAGARQRIPSVAELPAPVFNTLPPRNILVHVYNDRADKRFVILNSQRQREGDTTKDGFVIEEIRPDGVVLRFGDERFFNPR